jgi:hypothetical protein
LIEDEDIIMSSLTAVLARAATEFTFEFVFAAWIPKFPEMLGCFGANFLDKL